MTRPALNVGLLVDNLGEDYQRRIFTGLNEEAVRLNIGVVCFLGGQLAASGTLVHRNRVYECVSSSNVDALVVTTGTLGNKVGADTLASFVETYRPLPICSVGVELAGFPSVTIDNKAGARQALEHLIVEVGRRRIAFVRGPEHNREAEERFMLYRDVLREHKIALNPDMVTMGDFDAPSGSRAIETLIDERHMGFDAVMAASDLMALGAMNRLIERGVPVPERVSVVGFDDVEAARFAPAPLTTVRQPLFELGRRALDNVIAQVVGNASPERLVLPAVLVKRRSTVPVGSRERHRNVPVDVVDSSSFETAYQALRPDLLRELESVLDNRGLDQDWAEQLTTALVGEISGRRSGLLRRVAFLEYLEHLLLSLVSNHGDTQKCQELISVLRKHLVPLIRHTGYQREAAEDLFHEARVISGSIAERFQVQQRLMMRHWRRMTQEVGSAILRSESREHLERNVAELVPTLGIPSCLVCTYEEDGKSRVLAGYDGEHRFPELKLPAFGRHELFPQGLLGTARRTLLVECLHLEGRALGYVVCEMGPNEPEVYELLRDYLTGALRGLLG